MKSNEVVYLVEKNVKTYHTTLEAIEDTDGVKKETNRKTENGKLT
jgi:hypothetical protein